MAPVKRPTVEALRTSYADLSAVARSLDESMSWRATRCQGWAVRDLLFHLLSDAQRALVALAAQVPGPADRDAVTYWLDAPGAPDTDSRGIRSLRTMASAWRLDYLVDTFVETTVAAVSLAAAADQDTFVATQGHVLRAADFVSTLVVEAAVHHLDLILELPMPGPAPGPLAVVRATIDGLLGRATPTSWDDAEWALLATGRRRPTTDERHALGGDTDRLPLLR